MQKINIYCYYYNRSRITNNIDYNDI